MIAKLKNDTWHYTYTDGENYLISDEAPILKDGKWVHADLGYRIAGPTFYTHNQKIEFIDF